MRRRTTFRRLAFEGLESRTLLAGDVTAELIGGRLIVRGDGEDNRLTIDRNSAGEVRVVGDAFTFVNGDSAAAVFRRVTGNIDVRLAGGNDRIVLNGVLAPRDLIVDTGAGDDTILIYASRVQRTLVVRTGGQHDVVNVVATDFARGAQIEMGAGDDVVSVEDSKVRSVVTINTGRGDDTIHLDRAIPPQRLVLVDGPGDDTITRTSISKTFDFQNGMQGWQAGFSDYPAGEEEFFELQSGIRLLPAELGPGTGLFIQGNNHSDDLFMFLKRRLGPTDGIQANQAYQVRLKIVFASNAPTGCAGIGGAPGESVILKAGASSREPAPVEGDDQFLTLNVDKGEQASGGTAASVVSDVSNGIPCDEVFGDETPPWVSLSRVHIHEFFVRANDRGEIWLLVGTDSGFEGTTALFFQRIEVALIPITSVPPSRSEKLAR